MLLVFWFLVRSFFVFGFHRGVSKIIVPDISTPVGNPVFLSHTVLDKEIIKICINETFEDFHSPPKKNVSMSPTVSEVYPSNK